MPASHTLGFLLPRTLGNVWRCFQLSQPREELLAFSRRLLNNLLQCTGEHPPLTITNDLVPNAMSQAQETPIYEILVGDWPHWPSASSFWENKRNDITGKVVINDSNKYKWKVHNRIPDIWSALVLTGVVMEVVVSPGIFTQRVKS